MAKKQEIPGFTTKRKLLFGEKTKPEKMRATGEFFMDAGRMDDALEFFERCDAQDLTRRVARQAMEEGNVPLYMRAMKILKEDAGPDDWRRLAANAEKAGAFATAMGAYRNAGLEDEAVRVGGLMPGVAAEEEAAAEEAAGPE